MKKYGHLRKNLTEASSRYFEYVNYPEALQTYRAVWKHILS